MLVYVIALEEELNFELKVSQPEAKSDLEARIEALEKEVYKTSKSENNEETESGPAAIRTPDLRCVNVSYDFL
ncbi:hypothetical protein [Methanosarcina sp. 1.H.A.2.2]|uniref:hypothetical protein n=1 Tax=Methanosarcina sp. 1.H.A.2.2 TaxID=1483601 RepID=UPI0006215A8B|nr:hypothetical protein [Methanosarcina sp. 1.H.A.2.2]KKH46538.1 hypothetical protein EO93_04140 [Methanosarcina sp. 1.H.A.2.2]